jgi:serine/threonine protein kinase
MGVVYKAEDFKLKRFVVLKFLHEDVFKNREVLERFVREAQVASVFNHFNICTVYEIDEVDGQHFIAMELLEGLIFRDTIRGRPLFFEQLFELGVQIADALDAHRKDPPPRPEACQRLRHRRGPAKLLTSAWRS